MIVTLEPCGFAAWLRQRDTGTRAPGLHVSSILVAMLKSIDPRRYAVWGKHVEGERNGLHEMGYLWEDVFSQALAARVVAAEGEQRVPINEIRIGKIAASPDNVFYRAADRQIIVEETKATYMSCAAFSPTEQNGVVTFDEALTSEALTNDPRFTYWVLQAKTYAAMMQILQREWDPQLGEGRLIDDGPAEPLPIAPAPYVRISSIFINGYGGWGKSGGRLAVPFRGRIVWTSAELSAWWVSVQKFADDHVEEIRHE